ncbi:MAG TPA: ATP-binding protein, partial [Polyangiaceae bacterium]
ALSDANVPVADPTLKEALAGLADAREAGLRIRDIVRDLKLLSRGEDERRDAVDILGVLESSLNMARVEIRYRASVVKDFSPVPPVLGNESRLGQVFLNLFVNAAQALPEGRAETNVIRVSTALGADGRVQVEVRDNGSGMSPEVVRRLFTPFFTTKPTGEGTGLGLSICHRIVASLGGEITVWSEPGTGTAFTVVLPVATETRVRSPSDLSRSGKSVRRGRILVIDDEKLVGTTVRRALEKQHDVETTHSAENALSRLADGAVYDLILCDLIMPQMTGMDFYAALARVSPQQLPRVIFLTGGAFTPRAREFLATIDNVHIEKPFDLGVLRATVNARIA